MKTNKTKKKPNLPPHVFLHRGDWYVRVLQPTNRRDAKGKIVYVPMRRKCVPETAERAGQIVAALKGHTDTAREEAARVKTVGEFMEQFLSSKKSTIAAVTHQKYQWAYRCYIKGTSFSGIRLPNCTTLNVQTFLNSLRDTGASAYTVQSVYVLLSMAFTYAVLWGEIIKTPTPKKAIMLKKPRAKESTAMSKEEARQVVAACAKSDQYAVFALALDTGLRPQECLALSWENVDLKRREIHVCEALSIDFDEADHSSLIIGQTKTKESDRMVTISEQMRDRLVRHADAQAAEIAKLKALVRAPLVLDNKKVRGVNYQMRRARRRAAIEKLRNFERFNLVFPATNGNPRSRNNLRTRLFRPMLIEAGIAPGKYSTKHLRHTFASLMAKLVDIKTLQEILGHSEATTTMKYYVHTDADTKTEGSDRLSQMLYN